MGFLQAWRRTRMDDLYAIAFYSRISLVIVVLRGNRNRDSPFFLQSVDTERHDETAIAAGFQAEIFQVKEDWCAMVVTGEQTRKRMRSPIVSRGHQQIFLIYGLKVLLDLLELSS